MRICFFEGRDIWRRSCITVKWVFNAMSSSPIFSIVLISSSRILLLRAAALGER